MVPGNYGAFVTSGTWERRFLVFWESCQKLTSSHCTRKPDTFLLTLAHLRRSPTDVKADTETERNWIYPWRYCWDAKPNESWGPTYLQTFYYQVTKVPFTFKASLSSFSLLIIKYVFTKSQLGNASREVEQKYNRGHKHWKAIFEGRQTVFPPSALKHISKLHPELNVQNFFQLKDFTCAPVP